MRHDVLRTVRPDSVSDLHRYPAERPHGRPFRAWRDVSGVVSPTLAHPDHEKGGAHPSGTFAGSGIASPGSSDLASTSIVRFFTFGLGRPSRPARFPVQTDGQFMGLAQRDHDLLEDVAAHDILQRLPSRGTAQPVREIGRCVDEVAGPRLDVPAQALLVIGVASAAQDVDGGLEVGVGVQAGAGAWGYPVPGHENAHRAQRLPRNRPKTEDELRHQPFFAAWPHHPYCYLLRGGCRWIAWASGAVSPRARLRRRACAAKAARCRPGSR